MATANEEMFDALIRHQIGLLRVSGRIRNDIFKLLDATEADMRKQIAGTTLKGFGDAASVKRMNRLLLVIRNARLSAWSQVTDKWVQEMADLTKAEVVTIDGITKTVSPVILETTIPSNQLLKSLVTSRPFQGATLKEWASRASKKDIEFISNQVKIGMTQGESSAAIARRVVGTQAAGGANGVTAAARRNAAAITRTATNFFANQAKQAYYKENEDIIDKELYSATLDGRTTAICRSLDGNLYNVGEGPVPPLHFNCRSVRVAVLDGKVLGERGASAQTERGLVREFRKKNNLGSGPLSRKDLPHGQKGLYDKFARTRIRELTGPVSGRVTYQEWLNRQSVNFQDDVLGNTKGKLFRKGKLTLDKFVDRTGQELNLSQLARKNRQAFIDAGLDPEDFL